jgi:hypothetical protein
MRVPRFRIRTLMIAVVVVALMLGVARMTWLSIEYRRRALDHGSIRLDMQVPMDARTSDWVRRFHVYHQAMREKWERAARRPWLSVEPDPPEPK